MSAGLEFLEYLEYPEGIWREGLEVVRRGEPVQQAPRPCQREVPDGLSLPTSLKGVLGEPMTTR